MSKKSKGRPKQPKCPECGKAMYKRMDVGGVKKTDPYAWCRNGACSLHNRPQETSRFSPLGEKITTGVPALDEAMAKGLPSVPAEPEAVAKARARIKDVMDAAETQFGSNAVGLALAIVTQELGNHEAANALIAEYDLAKRFGIEPRATDA